MALPLHLLLRLPPALRSQTISPLLAKANRQHVLQHLPKQRPFTTTRSCLQQRPKPRLRKQQPQTQNLPASAPPKYNPLSPLLSLLETQPSLLLYRAPSHTSFLLSSYIFGGALTFAAFMQAQQALHAKDFKREWMRYAVIVPAIFYALLGTLFFLGPLKLIRTISLTTRKAAAPAATPEKRDVYLHITTLSPLPFWPKSKPHRTILAPLSTCTLDRTINTSFENLPLVNIPLSDIVEFTNSPLPKPQLPNPLVAFKREAGRMFWRDGMTYVGIPEKGFWKLDFRGAEVVEEGRVLERVMRVDGEARGDTWRRRVGRFFGR